MEISSPAAFMYRPDQVTPSGADDAAGQFARNFVAVSVARQRAYSGAHAKLLPRTGPRVTARIFKTPPTKISL
jgi:hypothetical protein